METERMERCDIKIIIVSVRIIGLTVPENAIEHPFKDALCG
jgi:hypothetical protein